jgi:hypothetical protein
MDQKIRIMRSVFHDENGCWNWKLGKDIGGYGRMKVSEGSRKNFRTVSSHRYSWELWNGKIPDGLNVLHRCDNSACCNPEHLFLGTQKENIHDMHKKGRGPKGYKRKNPEICAQNARRKCK